MTGPELGQSPVARPPHRRFRPIGRGRGRADSGTAAAPTPTSPGLYAGEPATCRRDLRAFLPIYAHLALLWAVAYLYRVEGRGFLWLLSIAGLGLPLHYAAPLRLKKPVFLALSVAGLVGVFGPTVAALVLGVATVLIGICYLPVAWAYRAGLVGAAALALALSRAQVGGLNLAVPETLWPVLGTMFMFRMIIFLYELKHAKAPERPIDAIGYFFLLPNYCFLHFPVVDYKTLQRGHFAQDVHATARRGLKMMVVGTTHLLLYRVVDGRLLIDPADVRDVAGLLGYLACNYLLYLKVSGQFHMACGMLHLFGYHLPDTHHHYLLATGFTDYWRRINIYWKDFMVRVVFHPIVFRLKRRPQLQALSVATVAVFVVTWALHAYQTFWLKGTWAFTVPDALFWSILGALVLVNVRNDARAPRRPAAKGKAALDPRSLAIRALKTAGTLATITVLWSLWSSPTVGDWLDLWRRAFGLGA
jgi:hypothetical protein